MSKRDSDLYQVEGFLFSTEEEAETAKKEMKSILYIKEKLDMDKPEQVLQLYNKMVGDKMFTTAVGMSYLADLQEYLQIIPAINNEDIRPIYVSHPKLEDVIRNQRRKVQEAKNAANKKNEALTGRLKFSYVLNLILVCCVILMFVITGTSKHPTIVNYETELVNRYAAWEQELTEREAAIREWEQNH